MRCQDSNFVHGIIQESETDRILSLGSKMFPKRILPIPHYLLPAWWLFDVLGMAASHMKISTFLQIAVIQLTRGYKICILQILITCIWNSYQSPDFDWIGLVEAWDSRIVKTFSGNTNVTVMQFEWKFKLLKN